MYRLFTLEQATGLLPVVDTSLGEMQEAIRDMLSLRQSLVSLDPDSPKARNISREIDFLASVIRERKADLDRLGVQLKDVESGLVDFPSKFGAEMILLTWERGQDSITHFRRLIGDSTPQPLPDLNVGATVANA
ncbi:MAG: DUF2203 domain-containing protein [Truepera sp.]|nr:DUF2203 domain-containing protein [Truepera sp.]